MKTLLTISWIIVAAALILSLVFYGQPDKGTVMIKATESVKYKLAKFLDSRF